MGLVRRVNFIDLFISLNQIAHNVILIQYKMITGRARLIRSHSSARFCFELSGKACNSNFGQNFELEFTLK